jgi:putative oxidoreductase
LSGRGARLSPRCAGYDEPDGAAPNLKSREPKLEKGINMKIGRLLLRLLVGGLFVGHGTQKLFGWFGGNGLDATAEGFEHLGLRPGRRNAIAAGAAEAGGGVLLAAGLASPLAEAALTGTMITAISTVHAKNGPWAGDGGYEYNLVLIAIVTALAETGPGPISLDRRLGRERSGIPWALAALLGGALGALGTLKAAEAQAPAPDPLSSNGVGGGSATAEASVAG